MWLILFFCLSNFIICCLFGSLLGNKGISLSSLFFMSLSLFFSLMCLWEVMMSLSIVNYSFMIWLNWLSFQIPFELQCDQTTSMMLFLVNFISFCVHIFSLSYMKEDPHLPSFMGYLSLFTFFMNLLVSSLNLIMLFVGWEGVGLCSYLLINFWFTSVQANKSAMKAMVVNKMGDIGMLMGMILLWNLTNSFNFYSNFSFLSGIFESEMNFNWMGVLLMMGVMAKSSQMGLHTWLPDAMEGPTPVSALIHAATMVTAGVYLMISFSPLFENLPSVLILMIMLGSLTSFFAATMGVVQKDVKKMMAYSTCSQLGYMTLISGFSYYDLSLFHLFNHGIFKALLFLSAGSLIHSMKDEQDLSKMGSIGFLLPMTYVSMMIGSFSLMGLPFLTGFYSKDLIIELVYDSSLLFFFFWLSLISAFLTSFYSMRLIYKSFINYNQSFTYKFNKFQEYDKTLLLILVTLSLLSIILGYMFEVMVLVDYFPVFMNFKMKILPLVFSTLAAMISLFLSFYLVKWFKYKSMIFFKKLYLYLIETWYFNQMYNDLVVKFWVNFGYELNYKLIDNQMLENFGPQKVYKEYKKSSSKISNYHLGEVSLYILVVIVFLLSVLIWL